MTLPKSNWQEGEYPTAVEMNKFSTALNEIHTLLGDKKINWAWPVNISHAVFTVIHTKRYLWFKSVGLLIDPTGENDDTNLNEVNRRITRLDLDTITWLAYGQEYKVTGVNLCIETDI